MFSYAESYNEAEDVVLINEAVSGSQKAVSELVNRHQRFIYNVALKFIRDEDEANDLMQEVLIKMVTKLPQYEQKSSFRTWLYRIAFNHFLNSKRKKAEQEAYSFDELGEYIDEVHKDEDMTLDEQIQYQQQIIDVRNRCMASTLLCLDREQRIVLILGSIFGIKSQIACELLDMTPENFRKQLSRAKADLFNFMENKCGLINPANSCRCHKKAKGFMNEGLVSPESGRFFSEITEAISEAAVQKNRELDYLMEDKYLSLFTNQPYEKINKDKNLAQSILADPQVKELFRLN